MTAESVTADAEMQAFCARVGELVLWASAIDAQLTKAVIRACSLTETPMLEPVVAELGARAKIEILRARAKHIRADAWRKGILKWVKIVEEVNGYRNVVAHYQIALSEGKLTLYSSQARKLLRRIKNLKPAPAKTVDDISMWVEAAKDAYKKGQTVLANLDRFSEVFGMARYRGPKRSLADMDAAVRAEAARREEQVLARGQQAAPARTRQKEKRAAPEKGSGPRF